MLKYSSQLYLKNNQKSEFGKFVIGIKNKIKEENRYIYKIFISRLL